MPVLRAKVVVLISDKQKYIKKFCKDNKYPEDAFNGNYIGRCNLFKVDCDKFMVNEIVIHSRSAAISVIAHEAVHAACYIMDSACMNMNGDSAELAAYIVQHICEEVEGAIDDR